MQALVLRSLALYGFLFAVLAIFGHSLAPIALFLGIIWWARRVGRRRGL